MVQVETAMGAAIEVFEGALTICVDRDRFVPVKTTDDLLVLRSDVYDLGRDYALDQSGEQVPFVELDGRHYKLVDQFDRRFPEGAPSLREAQQPHRRGRLDLRQGGPRRGRRQAGGRQGPAGRARDGARRGALGWLTARSPVEEHLDRVLAAIEPLPDFPQPLMETLGLAAAEDVVSPIALPSFDNSAMDGYAVRHEDVAAATPDAPSHLPVVGEIGAGQAQLLALSPGTAAKIMTGAPMPAGADSVVPYEWTDRGVAQVRIAYPPEPRPARTLRAARTSRRATCCSRRAPCSARATSACSPASGRATVRSRPRPRVVVISTGSELREPGTPLGPDSIYDGNSWLLAASARRAGAIAYRVGIVPDEPRAFLDALSDQLVRADLVVTSGGVSMGDYDVVKEALAPLRTVWFGPVAMQPGKPQGFGVVGEDDTPIFCLPGNPVSSYVSFEMFVLPALRRLMGKQPYSRPSARARLTHGVSSPEGRRQFLRGSYEVGRGGPTVSPVGGAGSHLVGELADANALIVVPEDTTGLPAGEMVQVLALDEEF